MAEKEEVVYWAPFFKRTNHNDDPVDWSLLYEDPEQLYKISSNIRQNVSEDIVTITGVLKLIDWYTEKCKGYKND